MHGHLQADIGVTCCSLDEDKIFERILADNWDAKDRYCTLTCIIRSCCCDTTSFRMGLIESRHNVCRLEKAVAKLPKKDLAAVKKRFAFLEVFHPPKVSSCRVWFVNGLSSSHQRL